MGAITNGIMFLSSTPSEGAGSVLDAAMKAVITDSFAKVSATVTDVLTIGVPVAVGVAVLSAGVVFAIKWVRKTFSFSS